MNPLPQSMSPPQWPGKSFRSKTTCSLKNNSLHSNHATKIISTIPSSSLFVPCWPLDSLVCTNQLDLGGRVSWAIFDLSHLHPEGQTQLVDIRSLERRKTGQPSHLELLLHVAPRKARSMSVPYALRSPPPGSSATRHQRFQSRVDVTLSSLSEW
jgi:hypothetical protein